MRRGIFKGVMKTAAHVIGRIGWARARVTKVIWWMDTWDCWPWRMICKRCHAHVEFMRFISVKLRRWKHGLVASLALGLAGFVAHAEDGYRLWLRYERINDVARREAYS